MQITVKSPRQKQLDMIQVFAKAMKWLVTVIIAILTVFTILLAISILFPSLSFLSGEDALPIGDAERSFADMYTGQRVALTVLLVVSFTLLTGALCTLRQVCVRFQKGEFFAAQTLRCILYLGVWLISLAIFDTSSDAVTSLVATLHYPEGEGIIDVSIDGGEILSMILGASMLLFSWIMRETALLAEENRKII